MEVNGLESLDIFSLWTDDQMITQYTFSYTPNSGLNITFKPYRTTFLHSTHP